MSITKTDIVAGGKTIIATLTSETFVPAAVANNIAYVGGQTGGRAGSTSTLSVNFALTGGSNSVPQAGDLVIISVCVGSAARNPACAVSGYTALGQLNSAAATNDTSHDVSYKFMGGTPDTSFTAPSTGNIADAQRWTVQVFRGVDPTTPLDVTSTTATGSATGRPNPPAITPVTAGAWVVICGAGAAATGAAYTAPANYTSNFLTGFTADTTDAMIGSGYWTGWASGSTDPAVFTGGTTNAADSWTARTIALRPAPGTTPFANARAAARDGITSAQSEAAGWNAKVRPNIPLANIVRTSDTVCTVTLQAQADYVITAQETVEWTIPGSILTSGSPIVATPTFTIATSATILALGQASETDTAQVLGRLELRALGTPTSAETAQAVGRLRTRALGAATSTETAQAFARAKLRALGAAASTETAQPLGRVETKALTAASSTETAQAVGRLETKLLGTASSTETAQALGRLKTRVLGTASSTETAQATPRLVANTVTVIPASETDTAQALGRLSTLALGPALEHDTAQALTVPTPAVTVTPQPFGRQFPRRRGSLVTFYPNKRPPKSSPLPKPVPRPRREAADYSEEPYEFRQPTPLHREYTVELVALGSAKALSAFAAAHAAVSTSEARTEENAALSAVALAELQVELSVSSEVWGRVVSQPPAPPAKQPISIDEAMEMLSTME